MRSFNFNELRSSIINNIECRLINYKGKSYHDEKFILRESYVNNNGYILIKNKVFDNIEFKTVKFENITFLNCSFKNCIFYESNFENAIFSNCDFENSIFKNIKFNELIIDKCKLKNSTFLECSFKILAFSDCDCRSFKFVCCEVFEFDFNDNLITKFDEDTFFDNNFRFDKLDKNEKIIFYNESYRFYKKISYKFQQNNLLDAYGEYYYLSKLMERKNLSGINKLKSIVLWFICGYGERPTYALFTCLEVIFIFTILYMFFGLNYNGEIISCREIIMESKSLRFIVNDFITAFHFSIVTFTTVGYGDITPIGYSIFLSGIEMFLGVTLGGLWTATLARKISR